MAHEHDGAKVLSELDPGAISPAGQARTGAGTLSAVFAEDSAGRDRDMIAALLSAVGVLVVVLDRNGRILFFNQASEQLTGYSSAEVRGRRVWDLLLIPEEIERVQAVFAELQGGRTPSECENFWVTKDGRRRLIRWSNLTLADAAGCVDCVIGTGVDLTERRGSEEALQASAAKYRELVEHMQAGVTVHARDTGIVFCNHRAVELLGLGYDELSGKTVLDPIWSLIREDGTRLPREEYPVIRVLATRQAVVNFVLGVNLPRTGDRVWLLVNAFPELGRDNELEHVVAIFQDITDRKRVEEALVRAHEELARRFEKQTGQLVQIGRNWRDEQHRREQVEASLEASVRAWRETFDASPDAICVLDTSGGIQRCNQAMLDLLGVSAEAVRARPCYETFHSRSLPVENCVLLRVRQSLRRQTTVWEREGKWYDVTGEPILDDTGRLTGIVHIMSDITDHRQADEARRAAEAELAIQRAATMRGDRLRSLGQMAAGIAHELNQPLVGVRGLAEHLLIGMDRGWKPSDERVQKKLAMIIEQADRMSHLIEHVRMFARDAGKPECRTVQVNDVVRSALSLVGAQLHALDFTWDCELADGLPTVWANPFSLEEVVLNLVLNARDAVADVLQAGGTPEQPQIRLRTQQRREGEADRVELQVSDRGTGIPPELRATLFQPFFTTKPQGTGLGLAICKSIVEQFGGTINLESTVGWGTSVTVLLPAEKRSG